MNQWTKNNLISTKKSSDFSHKSQGNVTIDVLKKYIEE